MLVIINADDLGASRDVNNSIFDLMSKGLISSSTIMANGPFVEDAAERAKDFPAISFGIHLTLTEFSPLSHNNDLKPVLDEAGNFAGYDVFRKTPYAKSLTKAIYSEFCRQIERMQSLGIRISHMDSHHHIHTVPGLFLIFKQLQKKYGLNKIRISRNIYLSSYRKSKVLYLEKKLYNFMLRHYYSAKTTSGFGCLKAFCENAQNNNLSRYKTIEVMVHPGSERYQRETDILKPNWYDKIPVKFEMINYNQL